MFLALTLAGCALRGHQTNRETQPALSRTFVLEGVAGARANVGIPGRIDHLAYDSVTKRLFVAALENGSVEVLDLKTGRRVRSITGLKEPQGAAVILSRSWVAVACGGDGTLHVYDARSLEEKAAVNAGADADNVRYDAKADTVLVGYGEGGDGGIVIFSPDTWSAVKKIPLSSHPESFQLDPASDRVFVNLPAGEGSVAVVSREDGQVKALIPLKNRAQNFPMAFDPEHERLFVATRKPARLIVIDTRKNAVMAEAPCVDDSDDLFYDAKTGRVFVIGGGSRTSSASPGSPPGGMGAIDVFAVSDSGKLTQTGSTLTGPHARTGLFVPARRAIYVAVPPLDGRPPEIREYRVD